MNAFLARTLRQSGVLMAFVLACSAGCAPPAVGGAVESQPFRMNAVLDQNLMLVEASGLSSRPVISDTRAITLARASLGTSSKETGVDARHVAFTLRNNDGGVAWSMKDRETWLVTFRGIGYPQATANAADCSCAAAYWRPDTLVAVDAQSGSILMRLGTVVKADH